MLSLINKVQAQFNDCTGYVNTDVPNIKGVLCMAANGINGAIMLAGSLAVIAIIINAFKLFQTKGDPKEISKAQQGLTWAVVGLVLALTATAIVTFLGRYFIGRPDYVPSIILPNIS